MLGSDDQSFYLLFPNRLDTDNRIKAHQTYHFPRPTWQVTAGGPPGTNRVLFVVSQTARDASVFLPGATSGGGVFTESLADPAARARLVDFFLGKGIQGRSGAIGAELIHIRETP